MTPAHPARLTVLFDADCGFCQWSREVIARLDRGRAVRFVPLASAATEVPGAPSVATLRRSMHLVTQTGEWVTGGEAWLRIMALVPVLWPLAFLARLPVLHRLVEPTYAVIARDRHRFGRLVGRSSCRIEGPLGTGGRP
jgi:predicted DCC family thiol-disulfide oxidoreductase YuxK